MLSLHCGDQEKKTSQNELQIYLYEERYFNSEKKTTPIYILEEWNFLALLVKLHKNDFLLNW